MILLNQDLDLFRYQLILFLDLMFDIPHNGIFRINRLYMRDFIIE